MIYLSSYILSVAFGIHNSGKGLYILAWEDVDHMVRYEKDQHQHSVNTANVFMYACLYIKI
jgi:hypothetical protein